MPTKLWRRAKEAAKDKHSLYITRVASKKGFRNPDLEIAIIKATSHDESTVDYKNAQRVFAWVRTSPTFLKPLIWALTKRLEKTKSWVVALKGLMLIHGVFCMKIPALKKIGRLPFDLSNFQDRFSHSIKGLGFSALIRAYFAFLDQRSVYLNCEEEGNSIGRELLGLERSQILLDLLLQIRPYGDGMEVSLVLEAMDCVLIEIFEVYSVICNGIANVLASISGAGNLEATMALRVLEKASLQSGQLSSYFEVCRGLGVLNAAELPPVEQIPEEDIRDLERLICGISSNGCLSFSDGEKERRSVEETEYRNGCLRTIVTENWVVFNDDLKIKGGNGFDGWNEDSFGIYPSFCSSSSGAPPAFDVSIFQCNPSVLDYQKNLICL
ncbi:putative clathrin assembly protein At1g25240 [Tasmannia lanceolata]|uniref:putative clathrin assembly protein At1g25240 n=1 Tax=Tasmannia lanceolata TaxID=3420 RepID=UPI0040641AF7